MAGKEDNDAKGKGSKSRSPILLILVAVAAVALAVLGGKAAAGALIGGGDAVQTDEIPETPVPELEILPFGVVSVNLSEGRLTRYLKVSITLELSKESADDVQRMLDDGKRAIFQSWLIAFLSDLRLEDVKGSVAVNRLSREIKDGFNAILAQYGDAKVDRVLFEELIVE